MGQPEFLYHGKSFPPFYRFCIYVSICIILTAALHDSAGTNGNSMFSSSTGGVWVALGGRGFCRFLRVVRRFAVTIFCGRGTGGGLTGGVQHRCFFRCGLLGRLGGSCLMRDSSCRGLRFSRRGGLRRGLCRDGIIRFRLPGRLRVGWVPACGRCSAKAAASTTAATTTARTIFFFITVFLFYIWGRCGISLPRCNAVRRWSGHPARGAGSAAAAGFHPPLPARGPYRHS